MTRNIYDYWVLIKIKLWLPLPLKHHFHGRRKIKPFEHWYCKKCQTIFFNDGWYQKKNKHLVPARIPIHCPNCDSSNVTGSTNLAKAILANKSIDSIKKLVAEEEHENHNIQILKRNNYDA
ncbi:MAG: hypothetical protein R6U85_12305 [Salinivirgaceae bacterium]